MIGIKFEFKIQDAWIGVRWKSFQMQTDIWICLIPFVSIHIDWDRTYAGVKVNGMRYFSRKEAAEFLGGRMGYPPGHYDRHRNYELEMHLMDRLDIECCISEPCPFNGDYCSWTENKASFERACHRNTNCS